MILTTVGFLESRSKFSASLTLCLLLIFRLAFTSAFTLTWTACSSPKLRHDFLTKSFFPLQVLLHLLQQLPNLHCFASDKAQLSWKCVAVKCPLLDFGNSSHCIPGKLGRLDCLLFVSFLWSNNSADQTYLRVTTDIIIVTHVMREVTLLQALWGKSQVTTIFSFFARLFGVSRRWPELF